MKGFKAGDLDDKELTHRLTEMEDQFFRLKFQKSMGQLDGVKKMRIMRKDKARILTALRQRELAGAKK